MADVITRFKLETTQYDSKLRDTAKNLQTYLHTVESGGKSFTNFSQKSIEYARALGQTASGANNLKDKVKDLVGAYNDAAKAYNKLTQEQQQSDFGKALSQSLVQLQQRIKETKQEFYGLGDAAKGGGLFGDGDMMKGIMQVAGGNLVTMGAQWAASLVGDVKECIIQSAELAKQAEGVQIAFKRLGRGDLLDGLREDTHGTVSDLELMKAAVKFKDFKLPVEELGTMLSFAQQKAKDTGQSIDYMVDSIVTGLGRKSLMILDNLGLSAAEIKEKMKETGDMTKAVGKIIREQMSKAGDYVETAADRAAKANVELNNAMLELGNTMQDVLGFSGWDELAKKIKTEVVGAIQFTIETIGEAKAAWNSFMQAIGLQDKPQKNSPSSNKIYPNGTYWESTDADGNVTASGRWLNGKRVQTGVGDVVVYGSQGGSKTKGSNKGGSTKTPKTEEQLINENIQKLTQEYIKASNDRQAAIRNEIKGLQDQLAVIQQLKDEATGKKAVGRLESVDMAAIPFSGFADQTSIFEESKNAIIETIYPLQQMQEELKRLQEEQAKAWNPEQFAAYQTAIENVEGQINQFKGIKKDAKEAANGFNEAATAINSVVGALNAMEDPSLRIAGIIGQAIAQIALGFAQATAADSKYGVFGWIAAITGGMATMISTISAIHSATGYAQGGIVDGKSYSGDNVPIMANAGELVLTRSMQNNLASQLQDNGNGRSYSPSYISGEQIFIALNRYMRRTGRSEIITWK